MAINQWVNVTLNPSAGSIPDRADHKNKATQGTSASGSLSVSWDSAVILTLTEFDSAVASARLIAAGQMNR